MSLVSTRRHGMLDSLLNIHNLNSECTGGSRSLVERLSFSQTLSVRGR